MTRKKTEAQGLRHDAQEDTMQMKTSRTANELKQARHSSNVGARQTRKLLLLSVVNLLVGINVWAQVVAPTGLSASSVTSSSVTLRWTDASSREKNEVVSRSLQPSSGYADIATLTASSTQYTDSTVQPSTTYYYTVSCLAKNGTRFTSAPLAVTTSASGALPTVTTLAATGITANGATANGSVNPNGLTTTVYFQYGTTTAYGSTTATQAAGSGTTAISVSASLGSLAASTTYHYRLAASNSVGTSYGADMSFTTGASGALPTVSTLAATGITTNRATANGSANPNGLATTVYFQFGTTTAYGSTTGPQAIGSGTTAVSASASLVLLTPSTTYHYRLVASNSQGTAYGADASFTTSGGGSGALPTATTLAAAGMTANGATVYGSANPNGLATTGYFQYGTTTAYGGTTASQAAGSGTTTVTLTASLGSLTASTTYHYRFVASNSQGTSYGADTTFTTTSASGAPPTATTTAASNISSSAATVNGTADPNGLTTTAYFQYGTTTAYGSTTASQAAGSGTTAVSVSANLSSLTASTTYHYRAVASNSLGTSYGADVSFTTSAGGTAPTISTVSPLPAATVGAAYSGTFTATGGTTPYTWSISAGSLPAGIALSSGGVFSGTPSAATTANFTVKVTGANGLASTKAFSLTVNAAVINYTVTTGASPSNAGTTSPNASFSNGSTVTAQATVNTGYSFVKWTQNGTTVSTSPSYSFQLNANVALMANFSPVYTITGTASPSSGGSIAGLGNGLFISGTTVSLTATPAAGYNFVNWTENGSVVSSTAAYGFTATANRTLVANFAAASAPGKYLWSWVHGGASQDDGRAVAVDKRDGSVLLTGDFSGAVDFGGGGISGTSGSSVMVAKYAADGTYQWAKAPTGNGVSQGQAVAVDTNGNVFVTGYFANTINFGAPSGAMTSAGWYDIFVVKYSPAGVCLWSKQFGSPNTGDNQGDEAGYALAVDSAGNVLVGGSFDGTANFGVKSLTATGSKNGFVLKLAGTDGTPQWVNQVVSSASSAVQGVAVDGANNVVITGWYGGTVNLGGGSLPNAGGNDIFVAKYSSTGVYVWANRYGGIGADAGNAVAVDATGNVFLTGAFQFTTDFGGGLLTTVATYSGYLTKLSSAGAYQWTKALGTSGTIKGTGLTVDGSGNPIVTGYFAGSVDFGGGLLSVGAYNIFLAKYTSAGAWSWSKNFGGTTTEMGYGVAADAAGNVFTTGSFLTSIDLGGGAQPCVGGFDLYLAKFGP